MKEEIEKLREVIDSLRVKASDETYQEYLLGWLKDPSLDCWGVEKLLHLRYAIGRLNQEANALAELEKEDLRNECDENQGEDADLV